MADTVGAKIIERGIFDPAHVNEAAIFAAWAGMVATVYVTLSVKHKPGTFAAHFTLYIAWHACTHQKRGYPLQ